LSRRADFEALQVKFPKKHKKLDRHERESAGVCRRSTYFLYYLLPGSLNEYCLTSDTKQMAQTHKKFVHNLLIYKTLQQQHSPDSNVPYNNAFYFGACPMFQ
jgi:hypothetical protein